MYVTAADFYNCAYVARWINGGLSFSEVSGQIPYKRGGGGDSIGFQIELSFKPRGDTSVVRRQPFRTYEYTFAYLIRFHSIRVARAIAAWKRF